MVVFIGKDVAWYDLTTDQIRKLRLLDDSTVAAIMSNRFRNIRLIDIPVSNEEADMSLCQIIKKAKETLDLDIVGFTDKYNSVSVIGQLAAKIVSK